MFWTALALAMTVFMGGIIAYNGDVIGRRYGKRRVSLFGLRPKHTAILITSLTGVFISGLTTGALFLLVPPVRSIILEGEEAIQNNIRFKKENARLNESNTRLAAQSQALHDEVKNLQVSEETVKAERDRLKTEREETKKQLAVEQRNLQQAQEARRQAEADKRTAQTAAQNAEAARHTAEDATRKLETRNTALKTKNDLLEKINTVLAKQNTDLARKNEDLTEQKRKLAEDYRVEQQRYSELKSQNERFVNQNDELAQQNLTLIRNNETLLDVNRRFNNECADLTAKNAALSREYQSLEDRWKGVAGTLWEMFEAMRTRRVAVHGGEDLARTVIPANAPPHVVREALENLRHDAHLTALARGAAPGAQKALAVQVVDKSFFERSESGAGQVVQVTEADRINAVVNRVAYSDVPVCVLALAVANSVEREPAAIDFQPFSDRLIYPKGRVVATRSLIAGQAPEKVFSELVDFLKDIGTSARNRGMIPFIDPSSGEPQVGSLGAADLVGLVERVRAKGGRVKIVAVAATDINAADPLQMEFRIEPSS